MSECQPNLTPVRVPQEEASEDGDPFADFDEWSSAEDDEAWSAL